MKREYNEVSWTEEDLRNIEVKEYSKEELEENFSKVKGKRVTVIITSTIFGILTYVLMVILNLVDDGTLKGTDLPLVYFIAYIFYTAKFVCIAVNNISDIKMAKCKNYFEVEVLEKLPIESYVHTSVSSDAYMDYFHPIKGKYISNGYETILYIGEENYEKADIGDRIKLPLKEDAVIRIMNRR